MIRISGLTKRYGELLALDHLDLEVGEGETLGFIGPNGAGKTTTLKILSTLLKPSSGTAEVCGWSVLERPWRVRSVIGYMPDLCGVYEDMRVREYLHFFGAAYGLDTPRIRSMVEDVLALTDLTDKAEAMADSLSRGMQQRLQLARVLLHDPRVLLLDEPASGLDPRARIEIRMLLKELREMGKTIIISSHILAELAQLCTAIAIIERGRLLYHGPVREAIAQTRKLSPPTIFVRVAGDTEAALAALRAGEGIRDVRLEDGRMEVVHDGSWDTGRVFDLMCERGCRLLELQDKSADLEDAFIQLTRGKVQ